MDYMRYKLVDFITGKGREPGVGLHGIHDDDPGSRNLAHRERRGAQVHRAVDRAGRREALPGDVVMGLLNTGDIPPQHKYDPRTGKQIPHRVDDVNEYDFDPATVGSCSAGHAMSWSR